MENPVEESYNKEHMKMAMLNHEHTFRHQVYELHRLYRIQKLLMSDISHQNRAKTEEEHDEEQESDVIEECEIELTLGPSSQIRGRRNKKMGSDSATSFSSSSSSTNGSAAHNKVTRNSNCYTKNVQFLGGFLEGNGTGVQVDDEIRLTQHHPWLYQVVSLNLT